MIGLSERDFLGLVFVYGRIGPCLMLLPGFSQVQIPRRIRGLLSVLAAIAIWLSGQDRFGARVVGASSAVVLAIASEVAIGVVLGLSGRCMLGALETFASAISASMGLTANIGVALDPGTQNPALGTMFSLFASALFFAADLHVETLKALAASYEVTDGWRGIAEVGLPFLVDNPSASFTACLRFASPFLISAIVANVTLGVMARMAPQLQIFALSTPLLLTAGLALLLRAAPELTEDFGRVLTDWLLRG